MPLANFSNARLRKMLAIVNITFVVLILADSFLFTAKQYAETVSSKKAVEGTGNRNRRYISWVITSTAGNEYRVPGITYGKLNTGDTFTVLRTGIFKRPLQISYSYAAEAETYRPGNFYIDTGMLRGAYFGMGAVFLVLIISVWLLFFHQMIKQPDDVKLRILLIASFITVAVIYCYFIAQM
jgi:hypothetical protein